MNLENRQNKRVSRRLFFAKFEKTDEKQACPLLCLYFKNNSSFVPALAKKEWMSLIFSWKFDLARITTFQCPSVWNVHCLKSYTDVIVVTRALPWVKLFEKELYEYISTHKEPPPQTDAHGCDWVSCRRLLERILGVSPVGILRACARGKGLCREIKL